MNRESTFRERASEAVEDIKNRVNAEEARRLVLNGKRYVRSHPVAAVVMGLSAGILTGYLAKAIVDRRRSSAGS